MFRELSCGARSVCFLLPQYRGRYVSQMRNTHGISKALQYLKTHRTWLASQDSGKDFSLPGRSPRWLPVFAACPSDQVFNSPCACLLCHSPGQAPSLPPKTKKRPEGRGTRGSTHALVLPAFSRGGTAIKGGLGMAGRLREWSQKGTPRNELKGSGARAARKEVNVHAGSVPNGRDGEVTRPGWRRERARRRCGHRPDRRSGRSCTCRCRPSRRWRTGWGRFRCCC